jgi:signal transduction histidine kinase
MSGFPLSYAAIDSVIKDVSRISDPTEALHHLLTRAADLTNAQCARLYTLHLAESKYTVEFEHVAGPGITWDAPRDIPLDVLNGAPPATPLERTIVQRSSVYLGSDVGTDGHTAELIAPVVRGTACLGVLHFRLGQGRSLELVTFDAADTLAAFAVSLLEKRAMLTLFRAMQRPLDYTQPFDAFMDDVLLLAAQASQMPYIAIRELDRAAGRLKCIAMYGHADPDKSTRDLEPLEAFPAFQRAVTESIILASPGIPASELASFRAHIGLDKLASLFVAPILLRPKDVFGTFSLGTTCRYDYSTFELSAFESLATSIGTAIANYRNVERLQALFVADAKLSATMSGLELAQVARHEARGALDNAEAQLATLRVYARKPKEREADILRLIDEIGAQLVSISQALDTVRAVSAQPAKVLSQVPLKDLVRQAVTLIGPKLASERVRVTVEGNETIEAYEDLLRHAILHLALNSLDAFRDRKGKGDRAITVRITDHPPSSVRIRYRDNAGGIDPQALAIPAGIDRTKPLRELIFQPGVTSKEKGSGFGLYLVRRVVAEHRGSVELADHRNGAVFDITLPRAQDGP